MSISSVVQVDIVKQNAQPSRTDFGLPIFLAYHTKFAGRYRDYTDKSQLLTDGFATTSPAYRMATVLESQEPRPPKYRIGRRANAYTQTVQLHPVEVTEGFPYEFTAYDAKRNEVPVSFEVDTGDALADVCDDIVSQLTPVAAKLTSDDGPFALTDGMTFNFIEDGVVKSSVFLTAGFADIGAATSTEVVAAINGDVDGTPMAVNSAAVDFESSIIGSTSSIRVLNGTANAVLGFATTEAKGAGIEGATIVDAGTYVQVAAPAGQLFDFDMGSLRVVDQMNMLNVTADPGIVADVEAIFASDTEGYVLLLDSNSSAEVEALATWVQTEERICYATIADGEVCDTGVADDVVSSLAAASVSHTNVTMFQRQLESYFSVGIAAAMSVQTPGHATVAHTLVKGVKADTLRESSRLVAEAKGAGSFRTINSLSVAYEGKTPSGEWIDTVRFLHYIVSNIQGDVFSAQVNSPKIGHSNRGYAQLGGVVEIRLFDNVTTEKTFKGLKNDPAPAVSTTDASQVLSEDKGNRTYKGITFSAEIENAIHTIKITGNIA